MPDRNDGARELDGAPASWPTDPPERRDSDGGFGVEPTSLDDGGFNEEVTVSASMVPARARPGSRVEDPMVGRNLGLYRVLKPLGAGGMGVVYLATHTTYGDEFALKILRAPASSNPQKMFKRFQREAKTLLGVKHPNIVEVVDFGTTTDGVNFLVMEMVRGETLGQLVAREGRVAPDRALDVIGQVFSGLEAAHDRGFVHRDLKPDNLLLVPSGAGLHVKVLDFGLAAIVQGDGTDPEITDEGFFVGTPGYIAPEVIAGQRGGPACDVYAAGTVLFEMLEGRAPFAGDVTNLLIQHANVEAPALSEPGPIADLVASTLVKDPSLRPTAAQARARVAALRSTPPQASTTAPAGPESSVEAPASPRAVAPGVSGGRLATFLALGVVGLAVLFGVAFWLLT
jgi:serine/threonine protein kinase